MTLTVEDRPNRLLELLWLREAYTLRPEGDDLPPMLVQTPERATAAIDDATRAEWEAAWARVWRASVQHAGREFDAAHFAQLEGLAAGSEERESALQELFGPNWADEFGPDALQDPSWMSWEQQSVDAFIASRPGAHQNSPERRDLEALIPAWRAGLTKIVTIPCQGEHTRKLGSNALLVTDETRADSDRYRAALRSFQ